METLQARLTEIEEEVTADDGLIELEEDTKFTIKLVAEKIKELKAAKIPKDEYALLTEYMEADSEIKTLGKSIKDANNKLENLIIDRYPTLTETEIKGTVIHQKWKAHLLGTLQQEQDKISQGLTQRINALAERYASPLPELLESTANAESKVMAHLEKMGLVW